MGGPRYKIRRSSLIDIMMVLYHLGENSARELLPTMHSRDMQREAIQLQDVSRVLATVDREGKAVIVGGLTEPVPGVYHSWMAASVDANMKAWAVMTRFIERVEERLKEEGARRIETLIVDSNDNGKKWFQRLGYEQTGVKDNYGKNGETYLEYSKILFVDSKEEG